MIDLCLNCGRELINVPFYRISAKREIIDGRTLTERYLSEYELVYACYCEDCFQLLGQLRDRIQFPTSRVRSPQVILQPRYVIKEKEVVREVIMVPCQHCGQLMPQTSVFCSYCGTKIKRAPKNTTEDNTKIQPTKRAHRPTRDLEQTHSISGY